MSVLPDKSKLGLRSSLTAAAVATLRGGNQVALKFALTAFAPLWTALLRMVVSSLAVFLWSRWEGTSLVPEGRQRAQLIKLGCVFTVQIGILHWGADLTSPAIAVILVNTNPIVANLLSHFFVPEDRLTGRRLLGLAVAFAGVCGVFLARPDPGLAPDPVLGNTLIVVSGSLVAVRTVYIQHIVQTMPTVRAVFWQMVFSLPFFAVGGWLTGDRIERAEVTWAPLAAIGYQGCVVGGLALLVWVRLLKKHTPGTISVFSFITPMMGLIAASVFFGEDLTPRLLAGLAAVLTGIALVTRQGSPPRVPDPE